MRTTRPSVKSSTATFALIGDRSCVILTRHRFAPCIRGTIVGVLSATNLIPTGYFSMNGKLRSCPARLARSAANHACFFELYQLRRLFGLDYIKQCRSFRGNTGNLKITFDFGLVGKFIVYFMTQHTRSVVLLTLRGLRRTLVEPSKSVLYTSHTAECHCL